MAFYQTIRNSIPRRAFRALAIAIGIAILSQQLLAQNSLRSLPPDAKKIATVEEQAAQQLAQLEQNVTTARQQSGEGSEPVADALLAIGAHYRANGDHKKAEEYLLADYKIRLNEFGAENPSLISTLNNLSLFYRELGVYERAVQAQAQALRIAKPAWGELDMKTAAMYGRLAELHSEMSDFGKAQSVCMAAIQIDIKVLGEDHPETARLIGQLAHIYAELGYFEWADKYFNQSIPIVAKAYGAEHFETVKLAKDRAMFLAKAGQHEDAEHILREVVSVVEKNSGADALVTAKARTYLASVLQEEGKSQEALDLIARALTTYSITLPTHQHPLYIEPLRIAGLAFVAANQSDKAVPYLNRALYISQHQLDQSSAIETDRQQITHALAMRPNLDACLSLSSSSQPDSEAIYQSVLFWKGAATDRLRQLRSKHTLESDSAAAEFESICAKLVAKQLHVPEPNARAAWMEQVHQLCLQKETIEQDLVYLAGQTDDPTKLRHASVAEVKAAIPQGIALIDLLEYEHVSFRAEAGLNKPRRKNRVVAFIFRQDKPVVRIELGDSDSISKAIDKWNQTRGFGSANEGANPAQAVNDLIWRPIAPHLEGCRTILVSPDGPMSKVAWNILPGRESDSYLIEDLSIGIVPVPRMLAIGESPTNQPASPTHSMLLIGDVDYDAALAPAGSTSQDESNGGELMTFDPLRSTGPEIRSLAGQFKRHFPDGRVTTLEKSDATETAFRRQAPQFQWLHVATHGFFSPPGIKAALATQAETGGLLRANGDPINSFNFGMFSGLALAGANGRATTETDDGLLTAFELGSIDLSKTDLVVLSGCETGLGASAIGEGTLGIERALQVAGVRTTISSLWEVPDQKTQLLMQRFYSNLWDRKLSKLESLREAQLWMMRTGGKPVPEAANANVSVQRQPPHNWAAFVLSGDWR